MGAGLPYEPWDLPSDDEWTPPGSASPKHDTWRSASSATTPVQSATMDVDPTPDSASRRNISAIANPQPLLPSQIFALGSIAADVEMVVPVSTTPQPTSSLSPRHSEAYQTSQPAPVSDAVSDRVLMDKEHPALGELDQPTYSQGIHLVEPPSPTEGDEYVADFLELYHHPSRHGSEDGHGTQPEPNMPSTALDALRVLQETTPETVDAQAAQSAPISSSAELKAADDGEDVEDLDDNYYLRSEHASHDQDSSFFTHSDSMLFSSPPSSFSLSRSISTTSRSSRASSDSVGRTEHTEDEDEDASVFSPILPRNIHAYRNFMDPSLSSLELDMEGEPAQDPQLGEHGTSTSRSSSSRPSLSRTRSSSDGSSDVLYSPTPDDYAMFPLHADPFHLQFPEITPSELASAADSVELAGVEPLSRVVHQGEIPADGWPSTFRESGVIGGGLGFGFDKLTLTAEAQGENGGGVGSESLAAGTSVNLLNLAHLANTATNSSETTAEQPHLPPSLYAHDPEEQSLVQQATDPLLSRLETDLLDENKMPGHLSPRSRPISAIKATSAEPADAGYSQSTSGRAHMPTSTPRRGNESAGRANGSQWTGYSSTGSGRYGGHGRGNSDDEDEDEQRRRRRALERGHAGETIVKTKSQAESSEDDTDRYVTASSGPASSKGNYVARARADRSPSQSPAAYHGHLPSSTRPAPTFAPSSGSSRYVSEEEDGDDSEDDDVPLAQVIPGALTAQKTIRRQVREEREQRKREQEFGININGRRARQTTIRPAGAGNAAVNTDFGASSSRDAAAIAAAAVATSSLAPARQRTMTLPGKALTSPVFNPHDLARKLQNVQLSDIPPPPYSGYQQQSIQSPQSLARQPTLSSAHHPMSPTYLHHAKSISRPSGEIQNSADRPHRLPSPGASTAVSPAHRARSLRDPAHAQRQSPFTSPVGEAQPPLPSLHRMRSFHRSAERSPSRVDGSRALGTPEQDPRANYASSPTAALSRSNTQHQRSMSLSRRDPERVRAERAIPTEPVPSLPLGLKTSNDERRRLPQPNPASTRSSNEAERPQRSNAQPPPLPAKDLTVTQQRVFVGNLQQFHMVEIAAATTAGDVVSLMDSQGALNGWAGSGGWMVFEVAQDFGMGKHRSCSP